MIFLISVDNLLLLDSFSFYELKVILSRFVKNIVMKIRLLFIGLFFITNLDAQVPSIQWEKRFGGTWFDRAESMDQTSDGGYILAGKSESNDGNVSGNHGLFDYWIVKLNSTGVLQWQKSLGGTLNDNAYSIQQTSDGGYIIAGESESTNGDITGNLGGYDGWIIKLSSSGTIEWQKSYGGMGNEGLNSIQQTLDGGYIVTGTTFSFLTGYHGAGDYWVLKLSATGTIEWQKLYGGSSSDLAFSVRQTSDTGYVIAGYTYSNDGNVSGNHGHYDFWIIKLSATGALQWQKTFGGTEEDNALDVIQTSDGGYLINGVTWSNNGDVTGFHGLYDYWVIKISSSGDLQWHKAMGGSSADASRSVIQTSDNGYIVIGDTASNNGDVIGFHNALDPDFWDIWIVKLNSSGVIQWKKALGGNVQDLGYKIKKTADGGFAIAGSTNSFDGDITGTTAGQGTDVWIVKFAPENLGISESEQKTTVILYPNPVNNELTVKLDFYLPSQKISISDVHGKTILTQDAEDLITTINTSTLSQGTYFLTVQNLGKKTTQKFIVE